MTILQSFIVAWALTLSTGPVFAELTTHDPVEIENQARSLMLSSQYRECLIMCREAQAENLDTPAMKFFIYKCEQEVGPMPLELFIKDEPTTATDEASTGTDIGMMETNLGGMDDGAAAFQETAEESDASAAMAYQTFAMSQQSETETSATAQFEGEGAAIPSEQTEPETPEIMEPEISPSVEPTQSIDTPSPPIEPEIALEPETMPEPETAIKINIMLILGVFLGVLAGGIVIMVLVVVFLSKRQVSSRIKQQKREAQMLSAPASETEDAGDEYYEDGEEIDYSDEQEYGDEEGNEYEEESAGDVESAEAASVEEMFSYLGSDEESEPQPTNRRGVTRPVKTLRMDAQDEEAHEEYDGNESSQIQVPLSAAQSELAEEEEEVISLDLDDDSAPIVTAPKPKPTPPAKAPSAPSSSASRSASDSDESIDLGGEPDLSFEAMNDKTAQFTHPKLGDTDLPKSGLSGRGATMTPPPSDLPDLELPEENMSTPPPGDEGPPEFGNAQTQILGADELPHPASSDEIPMSLDEDEDPSIQETQTFTPIQEVDDELESTRVNPASREKALFQDQFARGMEASRKGQWKEAVHHLSIALALDDSNEELKEQLKIAREKRREEENK
ncbi:hypothetical protein JXA32_09855 [Candidatus Sumerlaeota bacterium]|nr:hypothetical protein [Candidatus Sumerlaeota bacterium]